MKLQHIIKIILLLSSPFIIAGCGGEQEKLNNGGVNGAGSGISSLVLFPKTIQGVWLQNCKTDPSGLFKYTKKFTYTDNKRDYLMTYYSMRNEDKGLCLTEQYKIQITSDVVMQEVVNPDSENGPTKIDITGNKAVVTILSAALVTTINVATQDVRQGTYHSVFGFDITDWIIGEPRDLTTEYIRDKQFDMDISLLDIYQVSGDRLFLGDRSRNMDADNRPMTLDTNTNILGRNLEQWASTATASSFFVWPQVFINNEYTPQQATGVPDNGLFVGDSSAEKNLSWSEATEDQSKKNTIRLTFVIPVKISAIVLIENYNPGSVNKVEVINKEGSFVTVYSKDGATQLGGTMSGVQPGKVSATKITLNTPLDYSSKEIRVTNGDESKNEFNEIDAIKLIGLLP
ncbi:MAG: hypothetical protein KAH18_05920 [Psychromonas sp.]|nr:hypothetical protein [Psychromonas sp.]